MARMGASTRSVNDGLSRGLFRAAFIGARRNSSQSWKKPLWQIRTRVEMSPPVQLCQVDA